MAWLEVIQDMLVVVVFLRVARVSTLATSFLLGV